MTSASEAAHAPPAPLRVVTFDILRGIAIAVMVFLHNGAFHLADATAVIADPPPWLIAFGFLLLWAGLFGVVSGAANAATTVRRLQREAAAAPRPWRYPPGLLGGALQTFAIVFALHWVWTLGVGNSPVTADPNDPAGRMTIVPGWMFYGFPPAPHPESYVFASALWMIAANVLVVSLALRWHYRASPPHAGDRLRRHLVLLAIAILVATPLLRALLYPPMAALVEAGGFGIVLAVPLALLVNDPNPVFPFAAYGLVGAVIGASMARGESRSGLYRALGAGGFVLLAAGVAGLAAAGGFVIADREAIWGQSPLYFSALAYLLLGLFCWLTSGLLAVFDPPIEAARIPWRPRWLRPLVRFGRLSLTVFLLEGIVAMGLRLGLDAAAPNWNQSVASVLAFAAGNLLFWHLALSCWERIDYRGSLEWALARLRRNDDRARALARG